MSIGLIIVIFLFLCGSLAALAVCVRSGQYIGAGILAVLLIVGMLLFSSVYAPSGQVDSLRSEIADLKAQIDTLQDMANNPAYLAGICLFGASVLVGLVFFGVYGLIIIQAKIRRSERQERTDRGGRYLPHGAVRNLPEPVQTITAYPNPEYIPAEYQRC